MTFMQKRRLSAYKVKYIKQAIKAGVIEVRDDMTEDEKACAMLGTCVVGGGVVGHVAMGAVASIVVTKVFVVVGTTMVVGGIGHAFYRGFSETLKSERIRDLANMTREERLKYEGQLTDCLSVNGPLSEAYAASLKK